MNFCCRNSCATFSRRAASLRRQKQQVSIRFLTNQDALGILKLSNHSQRRLTPAVVRNAYLEAAKACHPDTLGTSPSNDDTATKQQAARQFQLVTEAYEVLLNSNTTITSNDYGITIEQEQMFRTACEQKLGLSAEIVEESKQCPAFRQWLAGKTDAAHYWRVFFIQHGGLAPQLRPPVELLTSSPKEEVRKSTTRRKRPAPHSTR